MNATEWSHNPQAVLSDLRDHLARHDKPIAFLLGAGASSAVKARDENGEMRPLIPAVPKLTERCRNAAEGEGDKFASAWAAIKDACVDAGEESNVENILSRARMMLAAVGPKDVLCGLNRAELGKLEEIIRKTIATNVNPSLDTLQAGFPHRTFARWLRRMARNQPVEIFTVNYDVLIEYALELERVPTFDGFVGGYRPFFHPDSLRRSEVAPGASWTRLWKMHGSVTWHRVVVDGRERIVRANPDPAGEMILPSFRKYDESRQQPYVAFTDRLSRFLDQDDALLIVSGFSFSDEHINNLVFEALEKRPRTHVFALQFEEPDEYSDLVKRAQLHSNVIVVGPHTGIVGGERAKWGSINEEESVAPLFEMQSDHGAESGEAGSDVGVMRVGDFALFCSLLDSMTTS